MFTSSSLGRGWGSTVSYQICLQFKIYLSNRISYYLVLVVLVVVVLVSGVVLVVLVVLVGGGVGADEDSLFKNSCLHHVQSFG